MTALPVFEIDPTTLLSDLIGADVTPLDLAPSGTNVVPIIFTPNVELVNKFIKWEDQLYCVKALVADVTEQGIRYQGASVSLLANDSGLDVTGIQWTATLLGNSFEVTFDAPADGDTVNVAAVMPAVVTAPEGVAFTEGVLITHIGNPVSAVRVALDSLYGGGTGDEYHEYSTVSAFPGTGVVDRIYLAVDTRKLYRWSVSASAYQQIADKASVGLGNADNTSDANKPVSTAQQAALDLKAPLASPTFTGTVAGITKAMVGLGSADNTADSAKPVSTAQTTAIAAAQSAAQSFATSADSAVTTAANSYAAAAAAAAQSGAQSFATSADSAVLSSANATAASGDSATLSSANATAATGDNTTLATATGRAIAFSIALG